METRKPSLFISRPYFEESPETTRFVQDLKTDPRVDVWDHLDHIRIGDSLIETISHEIRINDFVVLVLQDGRPTSGLQHELQLSYAQQLESQRTRILPVCLTSARLPEMLRTIEQAPSDLRAHRS